MVPGLGAEPLELLLRLTEPALQELRAAAGRDEVPGESGGPGQGWISLGVLLVAAAALVVPARAAPALGAVVAAGALAVAALGWGAR